MNKTEILEEILNYRGFLDNWDGEGSWATSSVSVDCAVHAIREYPECTLVKPVPMLSAQEDCSIVELYWDASEYGVYVDMSLPADGCISLFIRHSDGKEIFVDSLCSKDITANWFIQNLPACLNVEYTKDAI
jgi:hypothetical protein